MKKYILILLFTVSGYGQTLQNPTFGNTTTNTLKIKTPATITSVNFLPAFDADGVTVSKIDPVNLPIAFFKESATTGIGVNVKSIYLGSDVSGATLLVNKPVIVNSAGGWHTIGAYSSITQVGSGAAYASFDSQEIMSGSGNFNHFISMQPRNRFSGSGTLDFMAGLDSQIDHTGTGTITDAFGVRVRNKAGAGAITNLYGLYIQTQTGATNNWALLTQGGKVQLGDDTLIIGTTTLGGKSELISNQAKTVTSAYQYSYFGKTTETSNYTALSVSQIGGATQDLRQWRFQTIEQGVTNEGAVVFQNAGGRFLIGTSTDDGTNKLQVAGNIKSSPGTTTGQVVTFEQLPTSGTYTPTITGIANTSTAILTGNPTYTRVGNVITVTVGISTTVPAITTQSQITITLPVNRVITSTQYVGSGTLTNSSAPPTTLTANIPVVVTINSGSTTTATCYFNPTSTLNTWIGSVTFQYSL
jgi:hypothetical protein